MTQENRPSRLGSNGLSPQDPVAPKSFREAKGDTPYSYEALADLYGGNVVESTDPYRLLKDKLEGKSPRFAPTPTQQAEVAERDSSSLGTRVFYLPTRQEKRGSNIKQSKTRSRSMHGFSSRR